LSGVSVTNRCDCGRADRLAIVEAIAKRKESEDASALQAAESAADEGAEHSEQAVSFLKHVGVPKFLL